MQGASLTRSQARAILVGTRLAESYHHNYNQFRSIWQLYICSVAIVYKTSTICKGDTLIL